MMLVKEKQIVSLKKGTVGIHFLYANGNLRRGKRRKEKEFHVGVPALWSSPE